MHILTLLAKRLTATCRNRLAYVWMISMVQLGLFASSSIISFLLRFEFSIPREMHQALWSGTAIFVVSKALVFHLYRLDRGMWRYFNVSDTIRVTAANASGPNIGG